MMSSIIVRYCLKNNKWKSVYAFIIFNECKNRNNLMKKGMRFFDERYDYDVLDKIDDELINPFLNHIKEIISENNKDVNEYVLSWISFILQNPDGKVITTLVLTGDQGAEKNVFTDVIAELKSCYLIKNLTNIVQIGLEFGFREKEVDCL